MSTMYHLIVTTAFDKYQRGDVITDLEMINAILDEKNEKHAYASFVRRIPVSMESKQEIKEEVREEISISSKKQNKAK